MGRNKVLNTYDLSGEYGVGYTTNTGAEFYFDIEDYPLIRDYTWSEHILTNGYHALNAWDSKTESVVRMPWLIVGKWHDHINHNPLDNRRSNLRVASQEENVYNRGMQKTNTSGVIGVYWMKDREKWRALLRKHGKVAHSSDHQSFEDAVIARLTAEAQHFGRFAPQKNMFTQYGISVNGEVS